MRPQFHFTADRGWINDPHGITYRDGRYELFYQFVPDSMEWAPNCHWGHATSTDLFTFEHRPVAIAPGEGDDGIWTGCIVADGDRPTAFYTAVSTPDFGIGRVRAATPADGSWDSWTKGEVVAEPPGGVDLVAYRDPFVLREADGWRMLVGASLADGTAAAMSYRSRDLRSWTYDGIAAQRSSADRDPVWTGALWECPQIFELDGRHVLVTSVWDADVLYYAAYAIGDLVDDRFTAEHWGRLTYGDSYYAPTFFRDAEGRPSLMLWLRGVRDENDGWAGAHSVPHLLRLEGERLVAEPHPGIEAHHHPPPHPRALDGLAADARWAGTRLDLRCGGRTVASIAITGATLALEVDGAAHEMPYSGGDVRLLVDGPILELSTRDGILAAAISPVGAGLEFTGDGELDLAGIGAA